MKEREREAFAFRLANLNQAHPFSHSLKVEQREGKISRYLAILRKNI